MAPVSRATGPRQFPLRPYTKGDFSQGWLSQCIAVVPGSTYTASGSARVIARTSLAAAHLYIGWFTNATCSATVIPFIYEDREFDASGAWVTASIQGMVPTGASFAAFQFSSLAYIGASDVGSTMDALFDNASFTTLDPNAPNVRVSLR